MSVRCFSAACYSCFPAAVQSFAHDLALDERCPWTVTGAMPFAGGPYNSFSLEGVARMVEVLRAGGAGGAGTSGGTERRTGLVTNLSGIFGKQACALFSNVPGTAGYRYEDVTAAVAARERPLPLAGNYTGPATVVGYTVVFAGRAPSHAVAICDTPGGARTVVRSEERALLEWMMREEFCGRVIQVVRSGRFSSSS
jgi:acetyl-CoA C-acetyltransferase